MARKKPNNLFPVPDLDTANAALAEIAEIKRSLEAVNAAMNESIDRVKGEAEVKAAPLQTRMKHIEAGLQAFAEHNKTELFQKKKSVVLDFGVIGFRKSTSIKPQPKTTWAMVLGKIKEFGADFSAAIRTKEDVDKEELATWPEERLNLVSARRVVRDTMYYEVNEQKVAEKGAA